VDPALDSFRLRVLDDPDLRTRLLAEEDRVRFSVRVVAEAHLVGIDVDIEAVRVGLDEAHHRWLARWV
jgi:hypothetical protein